MTYVKCDNPRTKSPVFNNMFDALFNDVSSVLGNETYKSVPKVNILETETHFKIELAAPGIKKKDFKVAVNENVLSISVKKETEKTEETEENAPKYNRREFNYFSFQRKFTLPKTADTESIEAKYNNGVLELSITKITPTKKEAKEINID